jgi:hypothetical protein
MKIILNFSKSQTPLQIHQELSRVSYEYMQLEKDFTVRFDHDKTPKQLRGYYRICGVLAPHMLEFEGVLGTKDLVAAFVEDECNYITPLKGKRLHKSLTEASVKDMKLLIERLYEMGAAYGATGYELTSEEKKAMNDYYKLIKE